MRGFSTRWPHPFVDGRRIKMKFGFLEGDKFLTEDEAKDQDPSWFQHAKYSAQLDDVDREELKDFW